MVNPDGEGAGARGTTIVVVACVTDDEANIMLGCKGNSGLDIYRGPRIDRVNDVVSQLAGLLPWLEGIAALVVEEGGHEDNVGRRDAAVVRILRTASFILRCGVGGSGLHQVSMLSSLIVYHEAEAKRRGQGMHSVILRGSRPLRS